RYHRYKLAQPPPLSLRRVSALFRGPFREACFRGCMLARRWSLAPLVPWHRWFPGTAGSLAPRRPRSRRGAAFELLRRAVEARAGGAGASLLTSQLLGIPGELVPADAHERDQGHEAGQHVGPARHAEQVVAPSRAIEGVTEDLGALRAEDPLSSDVGGGESLEASLAQQADVSGDASVRRRIHDAGVEAPELEAQAVRGRTVGGAREVLGGEQVIGHLLAASLLLRAHGGASGILGPGVHRQGDVAALEVDAVVLPE